MTRTAHLVPLGLVLLATGCPAPTPGTPQARVDALAALVDGRLTVVRLDGRDGPVITYDVSDSICTKPEHLPEPELGLRLGPQPPRPCDDCPRIDPDKLVELIDGKLGESRRVGYGAETLLVSGPWELQETIAKLVRALASLRGGPNSLHR